MDPNRKPGRDGAIQHLKLNHYSESKTIIKCYNTTLEHFTNTHQTLRYDVQGREPLSPKGFPSPYNIFVLPPFTTSLTDRTDIYIGKGRGDPLRPG